MMAQPFEFVEKTEIYGLPLLFPGQTQKEFFVNQSLMILDSLLQASVTSSLATPPLAPSEGEAFRIVSPAEAEWSGQAGSLAIWLGGEWSFVSPTAGMRIYDRAAGQMLFYQAEWHLAPSPSIPQGGETVDAEARATLAEVVEILRTLGFIPSVA